MSRLLQPASAPGKPRRRRFRRERPAPPRKRNAERAAGGARGLGGAMLWRLGFLAGLLGIAIFLLVVGLRLTRAERLEDLRGQVATASSSVHNLESRLRICVTRGEEPLVLTEVDLNRFLQNRLRLRQGGLFAGEVTVSGLWVRLREGGMEVIVERRAFGQGHTVALLYEDHGNRWTLGARVGRQRVPAAAVRLILPAFEALEQELKPELALVRQMQRVRFRAGSVELEPKPIDDPNRSS